MTIMLTTSDNPFDPLTQWDDWRQFDESSGYHTCAYLARIANTSGELSEADYDLAVAQAIDEICVLNVLGIYKKIVYEDTDTDIGQPKTQGDTTQV